MSSAGGHHYLARISLSLASVGIVQTPSTTSAHCIHAALSRRCAVAVASSRMPRRCRWPRLVSKRPNLVIA